MLLLLTLVNIAVITNASINSDNELCKLARNVNQLYNLVLINEKEICIKKLDKLEKNLPVAVKEDFFDILYSLHSLQRNHCYKIKLEE